MASVKRELTGRVAIVTGGNRGIGEAISLELAQNGVRVVVNYNSSPDSANAVVEKISQSGGQAIAVQAQVADHKQVSGMVDTVRDQFGTVDFLVNNAGVMGETNFLKISQEDWDRVLGVNLKGVFNCCQAVIPLMLQNEAGGKIVNISSVAGKMGGLSGAQYAASKAGVIGLTMALSTEFAKRKIWVNAITPGPIGTEMLRSLPPEVQQKFADSTHVGRLGDPFEIAHGVVFLLQNDFVAGETLNLSAGRYVD
jgi:NAD(P)-dependent dehydrogenase (short-subunit alcohol dehydrogenase family)